jgi:hypothetical protein
VKAHSRDDLRIRSLVNNSKLDFSDSRAVSAFQFCMILGSNKGMGLDDPVQLQLPLCYLQ